VEDKIERSLIFVKRGINYSRELGGETRAERSRERDETCYSLAFVNTLYRNL
jgi:hypothetical protein